MYTQTCTRLVFVLVPVSLNIWTSGLSLTGRDSGHLLLLDKQIERTWTHAFSVCVLCIGGDQGVPENSCLWAISIERGRL